MSTVIGFLPLLPGPFRKTRVPQTRRSNFGTLMKQRGNSVQTRTFMTHLHDRDIPNPVFEATDTRGVNSPRRPLLQAVVSDPAANAGQRDNDLPSVLFQTLRNIFRAVVPSRSWNRCLASGSIP
jgi:hypothetical protein